MLAPLLPRTDETQFIARRPILRAHSHYANGATDIAPSPYYIILFEI